MARGFTLLEFLVASLLFFAILIAGCEYLDRESVLFRYLLRITRPEAELNYRMLLIRTFFGDATRPLKRDLYLQAAPAVFADLQFGETPGTHAFSVACPAGAPLRFTLESGWLRIFGSAVFKKGMVVLLAGPDAGGFYAWDYRRVETVGSSGGNTTLLCTSLSRAGSPVCGSLIPVEMQGVAFGEPDLYWAQPSGGLAPMVKLESFSSRHDNPFLQINWRNGSAGYAFKVHP